jgi:hypothetical protein
MLKELEERGPGERAILATDLVTKKERTVFEGTFFALASRKSLAIGSLCTLRSRNRAASSERTSS